MNFKDSAQHFNCLIKEVIEIKTMLIGDLTSTKDIPPKKNVHSRERNSSKIVIYGQICNSLVAIFFGVWFYNVLLITSKQSIFQKFGFGYYWPFCLVFGISFFFSLYGPMACTAEFLICHLIDTITNLFRDWKLSLDDNQKFAQSNPLEQLADDVTSNSFEIHDKLCDIENGKIHRNDKVFHDGYKVDTGLKLEKLVGTTNNALQGLTSSTYIYSIYIMIAFSFQMLSNVLSNAVHTTQSKLLWCIIGILVVFMYLMRLKFLMRSGQMLSNTIKESRISLEEILIENPPSTMKEEEVNKITTLRSRLECFQLTPPITPYGIFSLNNKTFFATLATMITYIVVLVKLRGFGDLPKNLILQRGINVTEYN